MAELEQILLHELTNAGNNILENSVLIKTLEDAKTKSVSIKRQQNESRKTSEELELVASGYRPAAKRGSILFFSLVGLSNVSEMYEYSLSSYYVLFKRSLVDGSKDSDVGKR